MREVVDFFLSTFFRVAVAFLQDADPRIRSAAVTGMIRYGGLDGVLVAAEALKALIIQQREVYGWKFIFLGADIDAVEVGERMGVDRRYAMTFDKRSDTGNRAAYARASSMITGFKRNYLDEGFTDDDRARAMGEAPKKKRQRGA